MIYQNYLRDKNQNAIKLSNSEGVPCILKHSKGRNLKNYEIYGNSYQATRSGKNLFDKSISTDINVKNETVITSRTYALKVLETNVICEILKPDTTYTLSCEFECTEIPSDRTYSHGILGFLIHTTIEEYSDINITIDKQMLVGEIYKFSKTFTTPSNFNTSGNYNFYMYRNKYTGDSTIAASMICRNIQIELGSTATKYEAYGISPSPEYPSEIQSVGNLTTKNLFDKNNANIFGGYIANNKLTNYYPSSTTTIKTFCIECKPNTTYTVSRQVISKRFIIASSNNAPAADISMNNSINGSDSLSVTITTTESDNYLYVWFYNGSVDTDYTYIEVINGIQIEEGSTATDYEPYHKYDIPITVTGKNLFNLTYIGDISNWETHNSAGYTRIPIYIGIKKTVTISWDITSYNNSSDKASNLYMCINNNDTPNASNRFWLYHQTLQSLQKENITTNTSSNGYIYLECSGCYTQLQLNNLIQKVLSWNFQIEIGESVTEYEPYRGNITSHVYLDEPLRRVGDYTDYIDFKNQKVVRKIGFNILNFSLYSYTINSKYLYLRGTCSDMIADNLVCLSDKIKTFKTFPGGASNNSLMVLNKTFYYFVVAEEDEVQGYIDNMQNVNLYYPLNTPIEESVSVPILKTFKGTNIIYANATVLPTNIKTKYIRL